MFTKVYALEKNGVHCLRTHTVSSVLNKRDEKVDSVLLDCHEPFSIVPHMRLVKKLDLQAGINGRLIRWIEYYLSRREQRRCYVWNCSEAGVPCVWI